jgi:hypothetical protein
MLKMTAKILKNSELKIPDVFRLANLSKHDLISDSADLQFES